MEWLMGKSRAVYQSSAIPYIDFAAQLNETQIYAQTLYL